MKQLPVTTIILSNKAVEEIRSTIHSVLWSSQIIVMQDSFYDKSAALPENVEIVLRNLGKDFSDQRNAGLSLAKNSWVFFLDSDEVVSLELAKEIESAIKSKKYSGYFIPRQDYLLKRALMFGEAGNMKLLRLAKKDAGSWSRPVHEIWNVRAEVGKLKSPIIHKPHQSISSFIEKINAYTSIEAQYRKTEGKKFSMIELMLYPFIKFFLNYVFKLGFLDGYPGFVLAYCMSMHSLIVRVKMYERT